MAELHNYYDLLELTTEATLEDIRNRYRYLKNLYGGDSIEIRALGEEFPQEIRADYLRRLDEAFEALNARSDNNKAVAALPSKVLDDELRLWIGQIECFTGAALKAVRERMQVDLKDVYAVTRIQPHFLDGIERESFGAFPAEVYLRSYLIEYARFFSLDTGRVVSDYLTRYREGVRRL